LSDKSSTQDSPHAIRDLLAISGDTLIGAKWDKGIIITTDGGKTWTETASSTHLKKITIDDKGILWGLDSWLGIHEPSYSRLLFSKDFGRSWTKIEFDVERFFPIAFRSKAHENLTVMTVDSLLYTLSGNNPNTDWTLTDSITADADGAIHLPPYKLSASSNLLKHDGVGAWDTLMRIPDIATPFGMLQSNDTLFIAAGGYGGYKAFFASLTNDTLLTKYEMESVQALGVRQDTKGRIWTFGDGGIFLLQGNKLKKMF
jgi:hypothetical protein